MLINEIFYSIQGEGLSIGIPTIFIRTAKCNLRCVWCDTKYAYYQGKEMKIEEILKEIKKYKVKIQRFEKAFLNNKLLNVCITGGEPLMQKETKNLIEKLLKLNYKIVLETNGSLSIADLPNSKNLIISLDIKCPSSLMHEKMDFANLKFLRKKDQLKFVIADKEDYFHAKNIIKKHRINAEIVFQPCYKKNFQKLAELFLKDNLNARFLIQMHKVIFGNKRGV